MVRDVRIEAKEIRTVLDAVRKSLIECVPGSEEQRFFQMQAAEALRRARFWLGNTLTEMGYMSPYTPAANARKHQGRDVVAPEADTADKGIELQLPGSVLEFDVPRLDKYREILTEQIRICEEKVFSQVVQVNYHSHWAITFSTQAVVEITLARNYLGMILTSVGTLITKAEENRLEEIEDPPLDFTF